MTSEHWRQIKLVFQSAIERPAAERAAFLDHACEGDPSLKSEVESLIAAHDQSGNSIEAMPGAVATTMIGLNRSLAGQSLGPYRIIDRIGQGGMGEVYMAEDGRLGRKVALKLLPVEFTTDAEWMKRLAHEARAASTLNHPNIITIYDIGEVADTHYIVEEFIDGETLRQRMTDAPRRRIDLREALDIAMQVAAALAAAHEAGIAHRDIKPENIMLRPDGLVKVLDFGLAKLTERQRDRETEGQRDKGTERRRDGERERQRDDTLGPSVSPSLGLSVPPSLRASFSFPGVVMGTPRYMSPEQAQGEKVDARADIFSLGVVLYEMIAGQAPFEGETSSDVIAALLTAEPIPLARLAPEVPAELQRVTHQALAKERDARQHTIIEFARQLRRIAEELRVKDRLAPSGKQRGAPADDSEQASRISRRGLIGISAATMAALLCGLLAWGLIKPSPPPASAATASEFIPARLTHHLALDTEPTWSPDGKQIAFVSNREGQPAVFVMNADGSGARRIHNGLPEIFEPIWLTDGRIMIASSKQSHYIMKPDGSDIARMKDFGGAYRPSPDGRRIVIEKELIPGDINSIELFVADADGGAPRRLTRNAAPELNARWSPDGKRIVFTCYPDGPWPKGSICIINAGGGGLIRLTNESIKAGIPRWSPDGTRIAFAVNSGEAIYVMSADGRNLLRLTDTPDGPWGFDWSPDGKKIVYATPYEGNYEIYVINSDPSRQTNITRHLAEDVAPSWSPDGKKIAFTSNREGKTALYLMDADGGGQRKILSDVEDQQVGWSPDGRRLAFYRKYQGGYDLYLTDADGANVVRLTGDSVNEAEPRWSPDGRSIVFHRDTEGLTQLYAINTDGGGLKRLSTSEEHEWQHSISPDGKLIAFTRGRNSGGLYVQRDIWVMDSDGGNPRLVAAAPDNDEFINPRFSPDGRRIAFQKFQNRVRDIWVMGADGCCQTRLTFDGGAWPSWSPDGKRIAFASRRRTGNAEIYVMDVSPSAGLQ